MKKSVILTAFTASIMALSSCTTSSTPDATADQSTGNAALECILTRTSVRQYQPDHTISRDTVETLLRAAMSAPTAVNKQPWTFIALDDRAALDSLAQVLPYARMLTKAPLAIVTCGDLSKAIDGEDADKGFWIQDVSAATENLLLAAHAMGLGAVWTGVYPDAERVKDVQERLGLPANVIPLAVVPVGYPTGPQKPKEKWDPANVHFNKW